MRWEQLFADLDSQFAQLADLDMMAELPDRQRQVAGTISLVQRCVGALGSSVRVRTRGGGELRGVLRDVGPDWLLLGSEGVAETLVSHGAITAIDGLGAATGAPLSTVASRFDFRLALRGIARDRAPVMVTIVGASGSGHGNSELAGTIDRVGADFIELAEHATWEPRRATAVRSVVLLPLAAIDSARSMSAG